jgi:hypothetical protein
MINKQNNKMTKQATNLNLTSEELRMLKSCISTTMEFLQTNKHNLKHHLEELEELQELKLKIITMLINSK